MSKGPPTGPRAPKPGLPERGVVSSGALGVVRGPLRATIRRLPSALAAPVASERPSGATFGRERPREWCPQRPSDSPNVSIYTVKPMIFEGRLFAEIGVQGPPWAPARRPKDPQGSPKRHPKGTQGPPKEPPGAPLAATFLDPKRFWGLFLPLFDFAKIATAPGRESTF